MSDASLRTELLRAIANQPIRSDTMEEGLDVLATRLPGGLSRAALAETVQDVVAAGLCRDPERLPAGALQCHWHLELSPKGRAELSPRLGDGQPRTNR
jgi:hypothetical protein